MQVLNSRLASLGRSTQAAIMWQHGQYAYRIGQSRYQDVYFGDQFKKTSLARLNEKRGIFLNAIEKVDLEELQTFFQNVSVETRSQFLSGLIPEDEPFKINRGPAREPKEVPILAYAVEHIPDEKSEALIHVLLEGLSDKQKAALILQAPKGKPNGPDYIAVETLLNQKPLYFKALLEHLPESQRLQFVSSEVGNQLRAQTELCPEDDIDGFLKLALIAELSEPFLLEHARQP